jgi:phenylacetic acid degradation operon negative regulatory protein
MTAAGAETSSDLRLALSQVLGRLQSQPSRTWSIIITFYGDALLPRGDSLWLGTLHSFFQGLNIADGVVRTAMSRLAADGWLERNKVGRNSFYRLTEKGRAVFAEAAERIYHLKAAEWDGRFVLIVPSPASDRDQLRAALEAAGFGAPGPGLWIAPSSWPVPQAAAGEIRLRAHGDNADLKVLAARAWPLGEIAEAYQHFIDAFAPLLAALDKGMKPSDLDAIMARVLMIHEYRRIVLRDPALPGEILPENWPGRAARELCAALYRHLAMPSENWLDRNGLDESGDLPQPRFAIQSRFN